MSTLNQMEIFYFVASWNSFSKAAIKLGVSKGYVSTQIGALEKSLGTKLLYRTTRHLSLTEAGSLFFESCTKIVSEEQSATSRIKDLQKEPSGCLSITAPPSMCSTFLAELLPKFQEQYPRISLNIDSRAKVLNLLQHGIDLALRVTTNPDENSIARLITTFQFVICATPAYLQQHGTPKTPDELLQHNCLVYSSDPSQNQWAFQIKKTIKTIPVNGNLLSADISIIKSALLQNHGITRLPEYIIRKEIIAEKLVPLFAAQTSMKMPLYAIYSKSNNVAPKIKCLIKFLQEHLV